MTSPDHRKYPRLNQEFEVHIYKHGLDLALDGTSVNISQGGAFIKTRDCQNFQVHDMAVVAFLLPPRFTGQDKTIGLQGGAVVSRIDQQKQGIGVEFVRHFRLFDLIDPPSPAADNLN
jgi:hypothetical protein